VVDGAHSATGFADGGQTTRTSVQYPPLFHLAALTASDGQRAERVGGRVSRHAGRDERPRGAGGMGRTVVGSDVTDLARRSSPLRPSADAGLARRSEFLRHVEKRDPVPLLVKPYMITVKNGDTRQDGGVSRAAPRSDRAVQPRRDTGTAVRVALEGSHEGQKD